MTPRRDSDFTRQVVGRAVTREGPAPSQVLIRWFVAGEVCDGGEEETDAWRRMISRQGLFLGATVA